MWTKTTNPALFLVDASPPPPQGRRPTSNRLATAPAPKGPTPHAQTLYRLIAIHHTYKWVEALPLPSSKHPPAAQRTRSQATGTSGRPPKHAQVRITRRKSHRPLPSIRPSIDHSQNTNRDWPRARRLCVRLAGSAGRAGSAGHFTVTTAPAPKGPTPHVQPPYGLFAFDSKYTSQSIVAKHLRGKPFRKRRSPILADYDPSRANVVGGGWAGS